MECAEISGRTPDDHIPRPEGGHQGLDQVFAFGRHDGLGALCLKLGRHSFAVQAFFGLQAGAVKRRCDQGNIGLRQCVHVPGLK